MKTLLLQLISIAFFQTTALASEYEFTLIKPGALLANVPESGVKTLEQQQSRAKLSSYLMKKMAKEWTKMPSPKDFGMASSDGDFNPPNEGEAPLYKFLEQRLEPTFDEIGTAEATRIRDLNQNFDLGDKNISGFNWSIPYGTINISAHRQLAPDLFDDKRYIVYDTFIISINAHKFLTSLREDGSVDMSDSDLALFAGVSFKRTYRYIHFAPDFYSGLFSNFRKLFLSFLMFNSRGIQELASNEILEKEDTFHFSAGGNATIPIYQGITGVIGGLLETSHVGRVQVQKASRDARYKMNSSRDLGIRAGLSAKIQGDFLQILKLTLLYYELDYKYSKKQKTYLTFGQGQLEQIRQNQPQKKELNSLLRLTRFGLEELSPYRVSEEERVKEDHESKYGIFLYSSLRKSDTSYTSIKRGQNTSVFYKSFNYYKKAVENFWSKLFSGVLLKLLDLNLKSKEDFSLSRTVDIDVAMKDEQDRVNEEYIVEGENKLSIKLARRLYVRKTTPWFRKAYKNYTLKMVESYSHFDPAIYQAIKDNRLVGPITLKTNVLLEKEAILFFNQRRESSIYYGIVKVCESSEYLKWLNPEYRQNHLFGSFSSASDICIQRLGQRYENYLSKLTVGAQIPLKELKIFLLELHRKVKVIEHYDIFFGTENVFKLGSITTGSQTDIPFQTYYLKGVFRGLGIVENYRRGLDLDHSFSYGPF